VEFEQIPGNALTDALSAGSDYSALKSWIPGGTITQYEWSVQGQPAPFDVDPNRFVLLHSGPNATTGSPSASARLSYSPLCVTIRGNRISPSGPETYQQVSASVCGYSTVPVISNGLLTALGGASPAIAVTPIAAKAGVRSTFDIAMAVRRDDRMRQRELAQAILDIEPQIEAVLDSYAVVRQPH